VTLKVIYIFQENNHIEMSSMELGDLSDYHLDILFKHLDDCSALANVCQRFREIIRPRCLILTTLEEAKNFGPYPYKINWENVHQLVCGTEFLQYFSSNSARIFFEKAQPNIHDLRLDFGKNPPKYSRELIEGIVCNNQKLDKLHSHFKLFDSNVHGFLNHENNLIIRTQYLSIGTYSSFMPSYPKSFCLPSFSTE
jgi:hypothetical protein